MTIPIITMLFFVAVLLGVIALYYGYYAVKTSPRFELRRRLRKLAVRADRRVPEELTLEILAEMTPLDRFFFKLKPVRKLDGMLDGAGLKTDVKAFLLIIVLSGSASFALGMSLLRSALPAALFFLAGAAAPLFFLRLKKQRRLQKFTEQFPSALDMIARSLKAGHSFSSAVQVVGSEMSEPIAGLFKTVYDEQTMGLSMRDALAHMSERVDSMDLKFFVTAVNIHREIGGNLSDLLERLAATIRERITIRRQVRVYTAQARLSGYVLAVLPVIVAVVFYFIAPDYIMELIAERSGRYAVAFAATAQIAGFFIIRRIINIRI